MGRVGAEAGGIFGLLIHWSDGTISTVQTLADDVKGKHLDQLKMIEVFPEKGGQIDKVRADGSKARCLELDAPGVPCPIRIVLPLDVAQLLGSNLAGKPHVETAVPGDIPGL